MTFWDWANIHWWIAFWFAFWTCLWSVFFLWIGLLVVLGSFFRFFDRKRW